MKSCLIVDDSHIVRKILRGILAKLNFESSEAGDGKEALRQCEADMPELILLDWNMPVMNGLEFLQTLRATPGGDKPVVIFCATQNDPHSIVQAMAAGANEYIMKPFDDEIIKSKLMQAGVI